MHCTIRVQAHIPRGKNMKKAGVLIVQAVVAALVGKTVTQMVAESANTSAPYGKRRAVQLPDAADAGKYGAIAAVGAVGLMNVLRRHLSRRYA